MIFVDTGFLAAHVSEDDKNHSRVEAVLESYRGRRIADFLLTTIKRRLGPEGKRLLVLIRADLMHAHKKGVDPKCAHCGNG